MLGGETGREMREPRCGSRFGVGQVDLVAHVETDASFGCPHKSQAGLGGKYLAKVVVEWKTGKQSEERRATAPRRAVPETDYRE